MKYKFQQIKDYLDKNNISFYSNLNNFEIIYGINSIKNANNNEITFFSDFNLKKYLQYTKAKACIIIDKDKKFLPETCEPIIVDNPYLVFAILTNYFYPKLISQNQISNMSDLNSNFKHGKNTEINHYVSIKDNTNLGNNVIIKSNVSIGPNVNIGNDCLIQSGSVISNANIGNNCVIQSGAVIGDKGFGFIANQKIEIQHIGNVIIGDNVHIGSNTTIDRAAIDSTTLGNNVRIDNLVQIAHNVIIGDGSIVAAQSGIAGSTIIGKNCKIGGQVGIAGHIKIGNNVTIAAKSGVTKNIKDNSVIAGFPATDIMKWKKSIIRQYNKT